jgi:hypothetical protein
VLAAGIMLILALTGCEALGEGGIPQTPPAEPSEPSEPPSEDDDAPPPPAEDEDPPAEDEEPPADDGACPTFPADSFWHADVSELPVHENSDQFIESIGASDGVHPDFGAAEFNGGPIGIPVTEVPPNTPGVEVEFDYASESDDPAEGYPIPEDFEIEGGGDRHIILHDTAQCRLYELFAAEQSGDSWQAGSGAVFDLRSNEFRPEGWTSADAAGLAIMPGLVQFDEVADGSIDHVIRMTVPATSGHQWPATHETDDGDSSLPPMGLWLRLKTSVDISGLPEQAQVIARAMQTHGVIVADNGSPWFITGAPSPEWNDEDLQTLGGLNGSDFEAVDASSLMVAPDSGAVNGG